MNENSWKFMHISFLPFQNAMVCHYRIASVNFYIDTSNWHCYYVKEIAWEISGICLSYICDEWEFNLDKELVGCY